MKLKSTIVFKWNWDAIHEPCPENCNKNEKCEWCLGSGRKYRYIINEGSSRSSKTYSIIDLFDLYARHNSNKRGTIWRESKEEAVSSVLPDIVKHHRNTGRYNTGYTHKLTDNSFNYDSNSKIEFHGADTLNRKIGLTQDFSWFNEPYGISKDIFDQIDQRTSDFILLDWNPKEKHWIDDLKKDRRTILLKSTFLLNPFCPPNQKAKILSYQPISRCFLVEEKILSEEDALNYDIETNPKEFDKKHLKELSRCIRNKEARTSNDFNWSVYGLGEKGEKPDKIYSFNKVSYDEFIKIDSTVYYGVDWGKVDPWAIVMAKYYDGELYVHELNYQSENEITENVDIEDSLKIRQIDEGIVVWMFNKLNIPRNSVIVCDNNRPDKIIALRKSGWEYAIAAKKGKDSIVEGVSLVSKLKVNYTEDSKNIESESDSYSWKKDRYGIRIEYPEDKNNHTMDVIRYIAQFLRDKGIIKIV